MSDYCVCVVGGARGGVWGYGMAETWGWGCGCSAFNACDDN